MRFPVVLCVLVLAISPWARAAFSPEQKAKLPPAATAPVDFGRDVKPIFDAACVKCHGKGKAKGGFSLETPESFMKGGDSGAPVVAGKSADSLLIELVSGLDPDNVMPKKGSKLKAEQVGILRAWIDQGVSWPATITFKKAPVLNLEPRRVALPSGEEPNPIDRLLKPYFASHGIRAGGPVDERMFARRVYLDILGVLPSPGELKDFLADRRPHKRDLLVEKLLQDNRRYAENWLAFWNDLLRNDYRGTGYIDGGRKQITPWLFSALLTNMPYDRFVAQLVNPVPESEGFINGITWRGTVNASQRPVMQAAQSIGQVFMGVNLKCASCHDSFINDYTLADSYGIAAIYATNDLEIAECDKPTGKFAKVKFLYSELGEIDGSLPRPDRTRRLAEILTSRRDGRLTRTLVNRLWARLMGRGLVEPVDEMDAPAWSPDLLDWLAEDFADHGYDIRHTLKILLTSRAYQMPAVNIGEQTDKSFVFAGPAIRRLSSEQFRDALGELTGIWYSAPAGSFNFADGRAGLVPAGAKWIWSEADANRKAPAGTIYLRKTFSLRAVPQRAFAAIACDNSFTVSVNGRKVASGKDFGQPAFADLSPFLRAGVNLVTATAVNHTPDNKPPKAGDVPKESDANPAGFIFAARLSGADVSAVVSDRTWRWSQAKTNGWESPEFDDGAWKGAEELGGIDVAPWNLAAKLEQAMSLADVHGQVRASLVAADPLMLALGRPNREQVMTSRQSAATTLQALELTNGDTLDKILKQGAARLVETPAPPAELVRSIFVKSLGREPTSSEQKLAVELIGSPAQKDGVEDLLWSVAMLPEFQLIY